MKITNMRIKDLTPKDVVIALLVLVLLVVAVIPMVVPSESSMTSYGNIEGKDVLQICPGENIPFLKAEGSENHLDVVYKTYSYPIIGKVKETKDCTMYVPGK